MMSELIFEPYAIQQRWRMSEPVAASAWIDLFSVYLIGLADACRAAGAGIIGHIKLLALFPDGSYLRISVVSPSHGPTVTGKAPNGLSELATTLNVLVYGLTREKTETLTRDAAAFLVGSRLAQVTEIPIDPGNAHEHHA